MIYFMYIPDMLQKSSHNTLDYQTNSGNKSGRDEVYDKRIARV